MASLLRNFAAEATADNKANQYGSRKPRQNPLTPGQTNSGQDAGLMAPPPDDAQKGTNMPGFATGQKGPTASPTGTGGMLSGSVGGPLQRAAAETATQKAGPPPAPPPGAPGGGLGGASGATQGGALDMRGDQGNRGATGPQQLNTATLDRMSDVYRWNEATKGNPVDTSMYPTKGIQPIGGETVQPGGEMVPDNGIIQADFMENVADETSRQNNVAEVEQRKKDREAQTEGMTPAEAALWDRLYGPNAMSDTEQSALSAQALADKNRTKEIIDRMAGGAGGSSAAQIMGTSANEFGYGQALGDIEKEKYSRQFAETQAAAGLAESAAARQERQANAFDEAQAYFGEKGYTVTAEGQLIGRDGQAVDTNLLTGKDRETFERFMYEMGAENPTSPKDKEAAATETKTAKTARDEAAKGYAAAKNKMKEIDKQIAEKQKFLDGLGDGQSSPQVESEIAELQKLRDTLAAGVSESETRYKEADAAYKEAATASGDKYEQGGLFSA